MSERSPPADDFFVP